MVFFTCNGCGTAFKKNHVERHLMSNCSKSVSCIDCQKDFYGSEFKAHTKCISEEEKYNGPDWKPKSSQNKGERKQTAWVDTVNTVLENERGNMNPKQIALLNAISKHDNVPRKKPKFMNFIRNIAKNNFDQFTIEAVFDRIDAEWKRQAEANKPPVQTNGESKENGSKNEADSEDSGIVNGKEEKGDESKKSKKSKKNKRKLEEEEPEPEVESKKKKKKKGEPEEDQPSTENMAPEEETEAGEFRWGDIIREILVARDEKSISLKKLKKKVFAEYYARVGDSKGVKTKEELTSQLNKKLKKKKFHVNGDIVRLVEVE